MKTLFLQGYGISVKVVNGKLLITNGKSLAAQNKEREITEVTTMPNFDKIVIEGISGWVSMEALKLLSDYNVNVIMVDKKGKLFANFSQVGTHKEPFIRQKQYDILFRDKARLEHIRKWIVSQKAESQIQLFRELASKANKESHAHVLRRAILNMEKNYRKLGKAHTRSEILHVEANVAGSYYPTFASLFNPELGFKNRGGKSGTERNSLDVINTLLNYGFSILQAEVGKQLNGLGLDCQVGFYHISNNTRMPLTYDMMEPFRHLVDRAVFRIVDTITDQDYHYRKFENTYPYNRFVKSGRWLYVSRDLKKRFVELLTTVFESKRTYRPRRGVAKEDGTAQMTELSIMKIKCFELRDYISGTRKSLIEHLKVISS